jgi:hypothetical protein
MDWRCGSSGRVTKEGGKEGEREREGGRKEARKEGKINNEKNFLKTPNLLEIDTCQSNLRVNEAIIKEMRKYLKLSEDENMQIKQCLKKHLHSIKYF